MIQWDDVINRSKNGNVAPPRRHEKSEEEWRTQLTSEQFQVARKKGTERAFSSDMCSIFEPGIYACICCETPLFDSGTKFESGSGWPSFTQPIEDNVVDYHRDGGFGMVRIEVTCSVCDAHLGHVFPDGPRDGSGLRYCINAVSLSKVEA